MSHSFCLRTAIIRKKLFVDNFLLLSPIQMSSKIIFVDWSDILYNTGRVLQYYNLIKREKEIEIEREREREKEWEGNINLHIDKQIDGETVKFGLKFLSLWLMKMKLVLSKRSENGKKKEEEKRKKKGRERERKRKSETCFLSRKLFLTLAWHWTPSFSQCNWQQVFRFFRFPFCSRFIFFVSSRIVFGNLLLLFGLRFELAMLGK